MNISKISFGGIHNIETAYKKKDVSISYLAPDGQRREAPGEDSEIHLNCILSDDEFDKDGKDLRDFYGAMHKSGNFCNNPANPYAVNLVAHHYSIRDAKYPSYSLTFNINGYDVPLKTPSDRNMLPLYTFMAQLTKRIIKQNPDLTPSEKDCVQAINDFVQTQAEHFIENIMV